MPSPSERLIQADVLSSGRNRLDLSSKILPMLSAMYENPMADRIKESVFELTNVNKTPRHYKISKLMTLRQVIYGSFV